MDCAAFLDRDGVINEDLGYVSTAEKFIWLPRVIEACQRLQSSGFRLVVVTNQGGIALGYYTKQDYQTLTQFMLAGFRKAEVEITAVYHCPYHPLAPHLYPEWKNWRKPEAGMILAAAKAYQLNLQHSLMVGDKESDMLAAEAAGITHRYYVGQDSSQSNATLCSSLADAVDIHLTRGEIGLS